MRSFYSYENNHVQCEKINQISYVNHCHSNANSGITIEEYNYIIEEGTLPEKLIEKYSNYDINNAVFLKQVHGKMFYVVDKNNKDIIKGKTGDALICIDKNIPILIFTADCVPIFIVDAKNKYIAAIHAGWRGTNLNITKLVAEFMIHSLNSNAKDLIASIGPSIGPCCYKVNGDVATKFSFFTKENEFYINLWKENKEQLMNAGLSSENIFVSEICTFCNKEFFSYRRDGTSAGRQINIIQTKE